MATATSLQGYGRNNAYDAVAASATDSVLVSAKADKKIRVVAFIVNQGDTTPSVVTFNSKGSGAGTAIFGPLKYGANGGTTSPQLDSGWFETNRGEGLTVTTGAGSNTTIGVVYALVSP